MCAFDLCSYVQLVHHQILQAYKTDPKMSEMMKNLDFFVTPVLNVDGYVYSWRDNTVSTNTDVYRMCSYGNVGLDAQNESFND